MEEEEESVRIVEDPTKATTLEPPTSRKRRRSPTLGTALKSTHSEEVSRLQSSQSQGEERPSKKAKAVITLHGPVVETHQPPVSDEWGVDMEEAVDVFNMDVGEAFGASESGNQTRLSSTRPGKSQTYVHMTNNAVHIKTLIVDKEAPQGPEDFR